MPMLVVRLLDASSGRRPGPPCASAAASASVGAVASRAGHRASSVAGRLRIDATAGAGLNRYPAAARSSAMRVLSRHSLSIFNHSTPSGNAVLVHRNSGLELGL